MRRSLLALGLAVLAAPSLGAQASRYVALDDPRLPLFEHLVSRGTVVDPSPQVRPFRRAEALAALRQADTVGAPSRRLIQELRAAWVQDTAQAEWGLGGRLGGDAYTHARRDPLRPAGSGNLRPYGELEGVGRFGSVVAVSRTAVEPRLVDDPDWPGRRNLEVVGRMAEGYLSAEWRWASLFYGTMDRQWGPEGIAGIPVSAAAYPRGELAAEVGTSKLRLSAHAATLTDGRDSADGRIHHYWFAHRLSVVPSRRLALSFWETTLLAGTDREFDARWRNPLAVLLLTNQYGLGADGNIMIGADVTWWARPRLRLEGQFAIDDLNYTDSGGDDNTPSRYAFTLAASGPLAATANWRLLYTQASSLAFRTTNPDEDYADAGVGLGRTTGGHDQLSLFVARPLGVSWLVTPELTVRRQGESELDRPFPAAEASAGDIGPLFIGTVETTWRAAVAVRGGHGALQAAGDVGLHYVQDAEHISGRDRTEIEGRLRVTLGIATGGRLQ